MPSADQTLFPNVTIADTATIVAVAAATSTVHAPSYATTSAATSALTNISGSLSAVVEGTSATALVPTTDECASSTNEVLYPSYFGVDLAVPEWEAILTAVILSVIIILTIVGNILVILSVFTYKPLRIVQNFFIVSLAVADLTVALLVLPFNVAYSILGRWEFGIHLCKMWLTCDVMCCTSSILNLCAIALDRYWAITDPINYAQKRTVGRVLFLIIGVWVLSLLISSPPLIGWNDWPEEFTSATPCELTSQRGYVIYSSLGSFFIPLVIMTIVYVEIYIATRRRLRERALAAKINTIGMKSSDVEAATSTASPSNRRRLISSFCAGVVCCGKESGHSTAPMIQTDQESCSSEAHVNSEAQGTQLEHRAVVVSQRKKNRRSKIKDSIKHEKTRARKHQQGSGKSVNQETGGAKRLLLPQDVNNKDGDSHETSAEGESDKKSCIQICTGNKEEISFNDNEGEGENTSLKITPPQSSIGGGSNLQKKPSGVYQFIEEKQKISLSKERRAARTLGIIMGVFVICWVPFFLMYVILPFCESCCVTNKFKNFITWLGYINSGLNPVIYTIFNLDYRRAFKRLLGIN